MKIDDEEFYDAQEYDLNEKLLEIIGDLDLDYSPKVLAEIKKLLEQGANPNLIFISDDGKYGTRNSLLHKAALCSNPSLARLLVEYGADSSYKNSLNKTPLTWAIESANEEVIKLMRPSSPRSVADKTFELNQPDMLQDLMHEIKVLKAEMDLLKKQPGATITKEIEIEQTPVVQKTEVTKEIEINNFDDLGKHFSANAMRTLVVKLINKNDSSIIGEQIRSGLAKYLPIVLKEYSKAQSDLASFVAPRVFDRNQELRKNELQNAVAKVESDIVTIFEYANKIKDNGMQEFLETEKNKFPLKVSKHIEEAMATKAKDNALNAQHKIASRIKTVGTGDLMKELSERFRR